MIASGATFDFFSNEITQAPLFIQRSGFEWLFRLSQYPEEVVEKIYVIQCYFPVELPSTRA